MNKRINEILNWASAGACVGLWAFILFDEYRKRYARQRKEEDLALKIGVVLGKAIQEFKDKEIGKINTGKTNRPTAGQPGQEEAQDAGHTKESIQRGKKSGGNAAQE